MRLGLVRGGALVAATCLSACLDRNPQFEEPTLATATDPGGATTTNGPLTTDVPPTPPGETTDAPGTTLGPVTTEQEDTEDTESPVTMTSTTTSGTTSDNSQCGNGTVEGPEECDDLNTDWADGCIDCMVPRSCADVRQLAPYAGSGAYVIDADGDGGYLAVPVYCDMNTTGGGWTVIERSPRQDPIGVALFTDSAVNPGQPDEPRFRLKKDMMELLVPQSAEMRIDCGGDDYLLAAATALFSGEGMPVCSIGKVLYKEAQLKGFALTDVELCTGFHGTQEGCFGAWHIDEFDQDKCALKVFPWSDMVPVTTPSTDAFAVDPSTYDEQNQPPIHDCHLPDAVRVVMLR
ncbi:fibrinogen-like YCDxxxxGGGW domain-containing protein [Nannocystis bainbridge]|uniref:Fibrinogen-like YCDxxxxGGGW domain-containing protein n=1 Tax=Nannocystis bainbridge TaxID=2995303 RepID=A0ABT5EB32_9BACT|nr:fibrinogen-like YCDxxxxGGGW domain-containing protein [Nannocystis bainbridge]MDC0722638.1 fibrinogen-like YCDxxxxGGGW domain-containing protein [Nannocystis bainbridge]